MAAEFNPRPGPSLTSETLHVRCVVGRREEREAEGEREREKNKTEEGGKEKWKKIQARTHTHTYTYTHQESSREADGDRGTEKRFHQRERFCCDPPLFFSLSFSSSHTRTHTDTNHTHYTHTTLCLLLALRLTHSLCALASLQSALLAPHRFLLGLQDDDVADDIAMGDQRVCVHTRTHTHTHTHTHTRTFSSFLFPCLSLHRHSHTPFPSLLLTHPATYPILPVLDSNVPL